MRCSFRVDHAFLRLILGRRWQENVWASAADVAELKTQIIVSGTPFIGECQGFVRTKLNLGLPNRPFNPGLLKTDNGFLITVLNFVFFHSIFECADFTVETTAYAFQGLVRQSDNKY